MPAPWPGAGADKVRIIDQLRGIIRQEIVVGTWRAARAEQDDVTEVEAREALLQLDPLWDALFPVEQARIVQSAGRAGRRADARRGRPAAAEQA
jgi:hypothetical protein